PITVLKEKKRVFWSNTNVNENYPGPITPLLYSIARESYYHYFKNLSRLLQVPENSIKKLEPDYANIIGIFGCKMYYNMSSIQNIIAASPFANLLSKSFNNFVGYQESDESLRTKRSFKNAANFLKSFAKLNRSLEKNVCEFEKNADDFHTKSLQATELHELRECFHEFIEIRMHSWYRASLADFFAMIYHGILGLVCKRFFGESSQGIHNKMISAIPDLISSKPVTETWKITELIKQNPIALELLKTQSSSNFLKEITTDENHILVKNSIEDYLRNWGFRCSGELMFTEKNYCEEPEKFIELLQNYIVQNHDNPAEIIRAKNEERKVLLSALKRKILKKRAVIFPLALAEISALDAVIKLCFKAISARERVRLKQALLYYRFKIVVLKIGEVFKAKKLIVEADDIFFLKYQEIAENLSGSDMLPQQLQQIIYERKEQFLKNSTQVFPDDFSSYLGEYPQPNEVAFKKHNSNSDEKIIGLSACGGFVKGRVRVLESVMEMHKIERGDILVTRQTDPGWASIFPLISGLIVERGGMLSHGAIVAREFGIPAIVGVHNATAIFKDGDEIELFADRGEIFKIASCAVDSL
ncbi:MAG: PEP-utilizing enzyme, partial [Bacteroidota bacterium]